MNEIQQMLEAHKVDYRAHFDFDKIINIRCEKKDNKKKKRKILKSREHYYKWYCDYNNVTCQLNLSRRNYLFKLDVYCNTCEKLIASNIPLSKCLRIKYSPILRYAKLVKQCKNCATRSNAINGKEKAKKTCLKRFGYESNFLDPEFKIKSKRTLIKKYGKDYAKSFLKKSQTTYFNRTGYSHNTQDPILQKRMTATWHRTMSQRTKEERDEKERRRMQAYLKPGSPGLFGGVKPFQISKISQKFYADIKNVITEPICIEKRIENRIVDFFIENVCVIEFFGDYWHANPTIYKENDEMRYHGKMSIKAKNVWEKDRKRLNLIIDKTQLPVIIIWESSYKRDNNECILNLCRIIKEIKEKINENRTIFY